MTKKFKLRERLANFDEVVIPSELFQTKVSLYKYKDCVLPDQILLSDDFTKLKDFVFRENDIIVASFPKAGTTWVQEIVYMFCNDCTPSDKSSAVMETRFPYLEYPYPGIKAVENIEGQRLIKTHLPLSLLPESFFLTKPKLIYVVRNPRDIAVSYFHFMKFLTESNFIGSFSQFVDLFITDKVPYSPLGKHIRSYADKNTVSNNIMIVSYEELKQNPIRVIADIAKFLKIDVKKDDLQRVANATSFLSMKQNPAVNYEHWKNLGFANKSGQFLRKGEIGDWRNYFDAEIVAKFADWEKQQNFPFTFKYQP